MTLVCQDVASAERLRTISANVCPQSPDPPALGPSKAGTNSGQGGARVVIPAEKK